MTYIQVEYSVFKTIGKKADIWFSDNSGIFIIIAKTLNDNQPFVFIGSSKPSSFDSDFPDARQAVNISL